MQYSFIKSVVSGVWMIDPITFIQWNQIALNAIKGYSFDKEEETSETKQYLVSANINANRIDAENPDEEEDKKVIAVTPLRGPMLRDDMYCGPVGTRTIAKRLQRADKDDNVIGHILLVDSGGGAADSVPDLAEAIQNLKKPSVAWIDGIMGSAAMYVGSYNKEIIASRDTDIVGSIGTMIQFCAPKQNDVIDGYTYVRTYADQSTEKNQEFEKAINENNLKLVKDNILNPHAEIFINDMKANRPNIKEDQLKGATYHAKDVVGSLIDSIGPIEHAVDRVIALAETQKKENNTNANNNLNNINMKNLNRINNVVGSELESVDNTVTLNQENVDAIDTALENGETAQANLETANNTIAERETELETANNTITEHETTIAEHEATIAELRGEAAAEPAKVKSQKEVNPSNEDKEESVSKGKNFMEDINAVKEAYM